MSEVQPRPAEFHAEPAAAPAGAEIARLRRPRVRLWSEQLYVDRGEGLPFVKQLSLVVEPIKVK